MPFFETGIADLFVFEPKVFADSRGYFFEAYNTEIHKKQGLNYQFVQDNQSSSGYGVIRGLHYQLNPHGQVKMVRAIVGTIYDVAVDLRIGSPTFGQYFGIELSAENKKQLIIPVGFAHGFSVLSEKAEVMYKCDGLYNQESEGGIIYNDPTLNINWQIPANKVIVSDKDIVLPQLNDCKNNFTF
jgi:dTDP-4-dehydrorhamnose 3,5-epimerase